MIRSRVDSVPVATSWLLAGIAECRGRQVMFARQSPHTLRALRETALVQSVESSNRIEGVEVAPKRLRPLVLGRAKPANRSEAELHGYREALKLIHGGDDKMPFTPALIRKFHKMIQPGSGDAGQWKRVDNEIINLRPGAAPVVRFRPVSAKRTPGAISELCRTYQHVVDQTKVPPLLADALLAWIPMGLEATNISGVQDRPMGIQASARFPLHPPVPRRERAGVAAAHVAGALPARP